MDTRKRSNVKSVTWRVAGIVILGVITYAITRDMGATTGVTLAFHGVRFVLYYFHERLWERSDWGRIRHPLSHYQVRANLTPEDHKLILKFLEDQDYVAQPPEYEI